MEIQPRFGEHSHKDWLQTALTGTFSISSEVSFYLLQPQKLHVDAAASRKEQQLCLQLKGSNKELSYNTCKWL